jgi:hypothetical protein
LFNGRKPLKLVCEGDVEPVLIIFGRKPKYIHEEVPNGGYPSGPTWHCIAPPATKSRRIVVTETKK